jgi:hypothetical protein
VRRRSLAAAAVVLAVAAAGSGCGGDDGPTVRSAFDDPGFTEATLEHAWRTYEAAYAAGNVDTVLALTSAARCPEGDVHLSREAIAQALASVRDPASTTTLPDHPTMTLHAGYVAEVEWSTGVDADGNETGFAEDWIYLPGKGWRLNPCPP